MVLIAEVALGYALGRAIAHVAGTLATVLVRRMVLRSPTWQALLRRDGELDNRLKRVTRVET